jgi:hypothetical protein
VGAAAAVVGPLIVVGAERAVVGAERAVIMQVIVAVASRGEHMRQRLMVSVDMVVGGMVVVDMVLGEMVLGGGATQ